MGMVATHAKYLANQTLQVKATNQGRVEFRPCLRPRCGSRRGHRQRHPLGASVPPCLFGFLATMETQERLTGDSEDRDYVSRVDDENWERMKQALASLR